MLRGTADERIKFKNPYCKCGELGSVGSLLFISMVGTWGVMYILSLVGTRTMGLHRPLFAYFEYFRHEILAKAGKLCDKYVDTLPKKEMYYVFGVNYFILCLYFFYLLRQHEVICHFNMR